MLNTVIIIDNQSYPFGGTAQVAYSSAIELSKRGYHVVYIAADKEANPDLIAAGVDVKTIYNPSINRNPNKFDVLIHGLWNKRMEMEVLKLLSEQDKTSSIIHVHGYLHCFSPSVLKACKLSGIKTALTLHDYFIVCPSGGFYNFKKHRICKLDPMSPACMICNCDKRSYIQKIWRILRQSGISKYAKNNRDLSLIYISEFSFSKMKDQLIDKHSVYFVRNPYDVGTGMIYEAENSQNYIFLGRLSEGKGLDVFCEAFTDLIQNKQIKGKAIVVGDGEARRSMEEKYPEVTFLGWKKHEEFDEIFANARALVFPSRWYEGAPLTPIEFMSRGIPCIISDSNSGKDYITDGEDGIIFRSEDIEDLKAKVILVEDNNYWGQICSYLRTTFDIETFTVTRHVDNLLDTYKEILD